MFFGYRLQNNLYNIQQSFLEVGKVFKKKEQEFLLQLRTDASSKMTMLQEWHEMLTEHQKNLEQVRIYFLRTNVTDIFVLLLVVMKI